MRLISSLTCLLLTVTLVLPHASTAQNGSSTKWQLESSIKYDALCLLKVRSGDPCYLHYYQAEYDHFRPLFTPEEQSAFIRLKPCNQGKRGPQVAVTRSEHDAPAARTYRTTPTSCRETCDGNLGEVPFLSCRNPKRPQNFVSRRHRRIRRELAKLFRVSSRGFVT